MRRLDLRRLTQERERAYVALEMREWWNGRTWRPNGTFPRTRAEGTAYKTAHDRLGDLLAASLGDGDWRAFKRFAQAWNALRKRDRRKDLAGEVERILLAKFGVQRLSGRIDKQLICDCLGLLGPPWTYEGVKSLLRRRRLRLQTPEIPR